MKKLLKKMTLGGLIFSSFAAHGSENLFHCPEEDRAPWAWYNCSLVNKDLSEKPQDQGVPFHGEFEIRYSFPCEGHETDFGITSGSSFKKLRLGASNQVISGVEGSEALRLHDPNPQLTAELAFDPGCSLEIHEVNFEPSYQTLKLWNSEAKGQSKILDLSITVYELFRDFESYWDWDTSKTRTMYESLQKKVELYEKRCEQDARHCVTKAHFIALRNSMEAKLEGASTLPEPEELQEEAESVLDHYRLERDQEAQVGKDMKERFLRWSLEIQEDLDKALERLD